MWVFALVSTLHCFNSCFPLEEVRIAAVRNHNLESFHNRCTGDQFLGWTLAGEDIVEAGCALCGPYSDNYRPALEAISEAKEAKGDSDIMRELDQSQRHIEHARNRARKFMGQKDGRVNGDSADALSP